MRLVNRHRAALGQGPLQDIPGGDVLARQWAERVNAMGVLAHDLDPDTGFDDDLRSLGCAAPVGAYAENAAMGFRGGTEDALAQALVNGWLGSPGHRAQIENGRWTWTTLGLAQRPGGSWTAIQRFSADDCSNL